jgi:elongation factor P hydroxylase
MRGKVQPYFFFAVPSSVETKTIAFSAVEVNGATVTWGAAKGKHEKYRISVDPTTGNARADPAEVNTGTHTTTMKSLSAGIQYKITITTVLNNVDSAPAVAFVKTSK